MNAINNSILFVWWFIPIVYVFWPKGHFCCRKNHHSSKDVIEKVIAEEEVHKLLYGNGKTDLSTILHGSMHTDHEPNQNDQVNKTLQ